MSGSPRSLRMTLSTLVPHAVVPPWPPVWPTLIDDLETIDLTQYRSTGLLVGIDSAETMARLLPGLRKLLEDAEREGVEIEVQMMLP